MCDGLKFPSYGFAVDYAGMGECVDREVRPVINRHLQENAPSVLGQCGACCVPGWLEHFIK